MKRTNFDDKIVRDFLVEAPGDEDEEVTDETEDSPAAEEESGEEESGEEEISWEDTDQEDSGDDAEDSESGESSSFLDSEIEAVLIDFETKARGSASEESDREVQDEGYLYLGGMSLLVEESEKDSLDIDVFASELARLVKNYDNLLDMESLLIKKAEAFISGHYDEQTAQSVMDKLESSHGISLEDPENDLEPEVNVPLAVGASSEGSGG